MATGSTPITPAMLEGPLLPPPPGVTPNFNAVNTYHFRLLHVMIAMIVLSATFIAMRLYTKIAITRQLWWDDCKLSTGLASSPEYLLNPVELTTVTCVLSFVWLASNLQRLATRT